MKKSGMLFIGLFVFHLIFADVLSAQWGLGAAVEVRDQDPTSGVGVKLEREIFSKAPIVDLNLRAHFSWLYDGDGNGIVDDALNIDEALNTEMNVYDYGFALVLGVKLGMVKPYIGGGIGREHYREGIGGELSAHSEESFYWNGFGGAEIMLLPYLKPFIEFRYSKLTDIDKINISEYNRLAIGITFRF